MTRIDYGIQHDAHVQAGVLDYQRWWQAQAEAEPMPMMTFEEHVAIYRRAFNEGRLTWAEYEAFFQVIERMYGRA